MIALPAALLLASALNAPSPLLDCKSGRSGHLQLLLEKQGDGYRLSSKDESPVNPRTLAGVVVRATRKKLDKRHALLRLELREATLVQVNGIDPAHCQADQASARCAITAVEIKTAKGGTRGPEDDGLAVFAGAERVAMEDGGPQGCTVAPSKELTALLKARK